MKKIIFAIICSLTLKTLMASSIPPTERQLDRMWIDEVLPKVIKSTNQISISEFLKLGLDLFTDSEISKFKSDYEQLNCDDTIDEFLSSTYLPGRTIYQRYGNCVKLKNRFTPTDIPLTFVIQVFEAMKELYKRNLVVVGSGLTIDRGNIPVPKGVISKKQYNEIVKNKKLYYYNTGSKYEFEYKGNTFFTFSEIKDVVNYLEFTHYFNLSTFTWEPKYREDHLRNLATEHVELLIKNYQDNDIHFNKANLIRLRVNENLDRIVMRVLKKDVSLRDLAIKLEAQNIVNKVLFND